MSKLVPQYTTWEAINAALSVGMRALQEIRALSRLPGKQGEPGEDGAPGKLPIVKGWSDEIHYQGNVVSHDGATYQATRDTAKAPPHEDWICLAASGRNGTDGRSFEIRGTYVEGTVYSRLDVVSLNGASFVAKKDDPGVCPGEGWQLQASQGKRGAPGETIRGPIGPKGEPGPPVAALTIDDQGMLTLVNADGSTVQCDLYPLLSKLGR